MSCSPLAEMPLPAMSATDQARRPPTLPRPRASTATSQNASGGQWSNGDLQKSKHLRNASEMSNVTLNLDSGKSSFTSDRSSATSATLVEKRRSGGRAMHKDGSAGRKADNPADVKVPMDEFALDELVDRLLERPTSESDTRFQNNFLCLYRKFAAPSEVIPLILQKFEDIGKDTTSPHLIRLATQLRSLIILVHWLCEFPGDFAHPTTSMNLSAFAKTIASTPEFVFSSRELLIQLENLKPDEDTNWACSDKGRGRASTTASFSSVPSLKISLPNTLQELNLNPSQESIVSSIASVDEQSRHANSNTSLRKPGSRASETSSITSSFMDRDAGLSSSSANLASQHEISQRHANMLLRQTRMSLTEEHWHEFMSFDNSVVAKELTRIDWIMFSAVRPRDLIRHINLSGEERANCKGLEHVDRMIAHFNHVASWVGQMILLRDKPKHRSRMLEKCMAIAWKLRQMNNYNGVGAFVAGISNVAISRLQQTKALVDVSITKNFMKLDILMGMTKGYSAYRLAWNNTSGEKIPFLPLHRHDLVVAEEGSPTFANSDKTLINWTKFDTMGRSLWDIQKAQKMHYTGLARNPDVQRLIMEGRVGEDIDDMLYDRSLQLEPGPRQRQDQERRWSHWLR